MTLVSQLIRELNLWKPQREGLQVLDEIAQHCQLGKGVPKSTTVGALTGVQSLRNHIRLRRFDLNFEIGGDETTAFPSFCFAIATGGGKTKLMGAAISYLYYTKGYKSFFILSKGSTVYNKHRLEDFNVSSPGYVFKGLASFPTPRIVDGDNYERSSYPDHFSDDLTLYIFNIEKIFNPKTDREFRFHRFQETIGGSFSDILRSKTDLVILMDESHNVKAEQSLGAINALQPVLGLEFTATPRSANQVYTYSLGQAVRDRIVKRPLIIARRDDDSIIEEKEELKLNDGIRRHERKKTILETYCRNNNLPEVSPRVLISAQSIYHSEEIMEKLESPDFWGGRYKGKVLLVHSGSPDEQIQQLLDLEKKENPFEIVVHVNKLKEGWNVKTICTIIPLRPFTSDILTEQTLGRGLRLIFGRLNYSNYDPEEEERNLLEEIDTLEIVTHDKFTAVVEAAKEALDSIDVAIDDQIQIELVEVCPVDNSAYRLDIPEVKIRFKTEKEIDLSGVEVGYDKLEDLTVKLVGTDLVTFEQEELETILEQCKGSVINFLVRILIERSNEFDVRDKKMLKEFVRSYVDKIEVKGANKDEVVFKNRGKILQDILLQINDRVRDHTSVSYDMTSTKRQFRAYFRRFPVGFPERHKDLVLDDDSVHRLITGYQHTIFSKNIFDSKQEKWLADILDRDNEVLRWVRPPIGQVSIPYRDGTYNPDFVVELKDGRFYVIEVKERNRITEPSVQHKCLAAIGWCDTLKKGMGKSWEFKLVPHDCVHGTLGLKGVLSYAVRI